MRSSEAEREVTNAELVIEIELQICHPTEDADPEMIQNETFDLVGSGVDSATERLIILDMEEMKRAMPPDVTSGCCIYRVPPTMRKVNEASYTPRVVSIGPFHHGRDEYASMENQKMRYLNEFVERTQQSLKDIVNIAQSWEVRARRCYSESVEPSSAKFVLMLLKDGVFIVEHMLRISRKVTITHEDFLVMKPWLSTDVDHDLILLENQLPFFVIHGLYALLPPDQSGTLPSTSLKNLINLIREYFSNYYDPKTEISSAEPRHLLHLIYYFQKPKKTSRRIEKGRGPDEVKLPKFSATRLHQAGVKFEFLKSKCLPDIEFKKEDGALEIPILQIEDSSESFLRNLLAFEQCHYPYCELYIAYYILLLDKLVNTSGDVDVLEKHGIIENFIGDNETLATIINKLGAHITLWEGKDQNYFESICNDLDAYCSVPRHEWMATCRREYCSTPWRILSIIAATILLILTMIQTINSIAAFFV